ncbi:MAG: hypothetical protein JXB49_19895 [Bacteroidales bacterium]|nr:hypothetical protein [Bacteroidales bacterium]
MRDDGSKLGRKMKNEVKLPDEWRKTREKGRRNANNASGWNVSPPLSALRTSLRQLVEEPNCYETFSWFLIQGCLIKAESLLAIVQGNALHNLNILL